MNNTVTLIREYGIIPKLEKGTDAKAPADALCAAGLPIIELAKADASAVRALKTAHPGMLVGLRGIESAEEAQAAVAAGADFIRIKVFCDKAAKASPVPVLYAPDGAEDEKKAAESGLVIVRCMRCEYIPADAAAVLNNDICSAADPAAAAKEALYLSFGFTLAHIGINGKDEADAIATADLFSSLLGLKTKVGNSSVFSGKIVEVMKKPFLGANGHIAIGSHSMARAVAFFRRSGIEFREETAKFKDDGTPVAIYFKNDIAGFAIHLVNIG